jgi:hypothetical protein
MTHDLDLSLEVLVLIVFALFMALFGVLLVPIHIGALPYNPDATYGLFLVIVSFQIITLGKTPFGDFRRSWLLIAIGIGIAVLGMVACFIPGSLTGVARQSVGWLLLGGGLSLLAQLFIADDKARLWLKVDGVLRQLTLACTLVYALLAGLGAVTLVPGLATDAQTALVLIAAGAAFGYLAWCIWQVRQAYPPRPPPLGAAAGAPQSFALLREAALPLSQAILILLGLLLSCLGLLLVPVSLGLLPFSADGQLGLLLTVMAIQILALGETPLGQFRRSWLLIVIGLGFAAAGVFSAIVPGLLTKALQSLLGLMNLLSGGVSLVKQQLPRRGQSPPPAEVPVLVRALTTTQTALNCVAIGFGVSVLMPGLVPGPVTAAILVLNGLLLFVLAFILGRLPAASPS